MCDEKLRSDEVPQKFTEWLLAMGCPSENVPSIDKVSGMCRGQYYMVWRSLMERVQAKDVVKTKRLQVFCDDIKKCQKKGIFNERDSNVVVPEELVLWRQHTQLKEKVADTDARVSEEKENLNQLMEKISCKLANRNILRKKLQDTQRRVWLLHQLSSELQAKKENLEETKTIANSLCTLDEGADIDNKLDTYMKSQNKQETAAAFPTENNDVISSLVKCRGDMLMECLHARRAALCNDMPAPTTADVKDSGKRQRLPMINAVMPRSLSYHKVQGNTADAHYLETALCNDMPAPTTTDAKDSVTLRCVVTQSAALHCSLALEAAKNRLHIAATRDNLAAALNHISSYLSGPSCELLVRQCEVARGEARLVSLRGCARQLAVLAGGILAPGGNVTPAGGNVVPAGGNGTPAPGGKLHRVDADIEAKKDELKRLIASVAAVERKTVSARDCLVALFNSFHEDRGSDNRFGRSSLPQDTMASLNKFYAEKRKKTSKMQLSMDLDVSESFTDGTETHNPKFVDELKIYLKKFKLEDNRKLVLESGEKIWSFETVQSSIDRIRTTWLDENITLLCPSVTLTSNLRRLTKHTDRMMELEAVLRSDSDEKSGRLQRDLDITPRILEEQRILDQIKKRLNENIQSLQKTDKTVNIIIENVQYWSENSMRRYISEKRRVDGKSYKEYEDYYKEFMSLY